MMNDNFKNFLKEKKDLLIFMGVWVLTFIGVISIATFATRGGDTGEAGGGPNNGGNNNVPTEIVNTPLPTPEVPQIETFALPISGEYVITRQYFDLDNTDTMQDAVKTNGTTSFEDSRGISFAKADNSVFNVFSVYAGTVKAVNDEENSLEGMMVTIEHSDGVISVYSSLSSVNVKVGDVVTINQKIGVAGTSVHDTEAGICVHLELIQNGNYINPVSAIGKPTSELASVVK